MSYDIQLSESRKFFRIRLEGKVSVPDSRDWCTELETLAHEHGIHRFLFDARDARNVSSTFDHYHFAYEEADRLPLDRGARSAIVTSPGDNSHDFVAVTLRNAGFNVKLFTDISAAIAWLEKDEPEEDHLTTRQRTTDH